MHASRTFVPSPTLVPAGGGGRSGAASADAESRAKAAEAATKKLRDELEKQRAENKKLMLAPGEHG